ncbi:PilZ domain-containing protein [Anatilimnocola floriformis]|uniref:PilZ domain-containing protein n=1 Tax=Anatilimnocola floriformis TaxID=2948575 RepID=UPI0020C3F7CD|nr:PilZ domain-containing protein [Anatilimnocola floriformis]
MTTEFDQNRRNSPRNPAHLVVAVQPVNGQREAMGARLDAVSIDLSRGGLCLMSDHPLLSDLAIVDLLAADSDQIIRLLAERIRCRRKGSMFEIAVRFVEKLS